MKGMFKTLALVAIATLALTGCYKHDPVVRPDNNTPQGPTEEKLVVTDMSDRDWSIRYVAREDYFNDDGGVEKVEHFRLSSNMCFLTRQPVVRDVSPSHLPSGESDEPPGRYWYDVPHGVE